MLGIVTITVGQREAEDANERNPQREMAMKPSVADGPEELPEIIDPLPTSESNLEELAQPPESQSTDVGFKKVFKFVGLKFTVKKEKNEKSDNVQLVTVKKDEGEGAGDHQEPGREEGETTPQESELKQSTELPEETQNEAQKEAAQSAPDPAPPAEPAPAPKPAAEPGQEDQEEKQEQEPARAPEPASSPPPSDTSSPFKKFFSQGWAGWRKKTSFRKTKEELLDTSEKKREPEAEKGEAEDKEKPQEDASTQELAQEGAPPSSAEARLSAEYEKVELPLEDGALGSPEERAAPLASEVFDEKVETVAQVHVGPSEKTPEEHTEEPLEPSVPERPPDSHAEPQEAPKEPVTPPEPSKAEQGTLAKPTELRPEGRTPAAGPPEGIVSEADALAAQERSKMQGSPLKKLFTSSGLKKLSGKKQKGKRGGGDEEGGDQLPAAALDSPDSAEEPRGESSASSPEDPEGPTGDLAAATVDAEEGGVSDGERAVKREGVTPWASFKKMVTPKKRVRRPSESDREEEPEKGKSATLSSTESAVSEAPDEEPKRKVDSSVSWEALICVGSSKKRARKASSSDDEGTPKAMAGDGPKPEEAASDDREPTMATATSVPRSAAPDPDHAGTTNPGQGSSSPEQASSPTDGDGVSTWESFKRLVTTRKKSRTRLEEKNEDSAASGPERGASETDVAKEESWVSIRKLIPGRKKKRADGKPEPATGPADAADDDSDVPAVVPLSEYDAVEREKLEAQQQGRASEVPPGAPTAVDVPEELSQTLVHTVVMDVVDGARAVASASEERAPSWISASVSEPLESTEEDLQVQTTVVLASEMPPEEDTTAVPLPDSQDTSEGEGASEAVTAAEPTEATEASGAEETTEMVSAVSQLGDSPCTTEEATPVQEAEGGLPDQAELERRTKEVLQAVAAMVGEDELEQVTPLQELRKQEPEEGPQLPTPGAGSAPAPPEQAELIEPVPDSQMGAMEKPQPGQASAPDSADTLTDSETNSSTPVADAEGLGALDKVVGMREAQNEEAVGVATPPKEMPPTPSGYQLQEEVLEQSTAAETLVEAEKAIPVETAPSFPDVVGHQVAGEPRAEGTRDEPEAGSLTLPKDEDGSFKQEESEPVLALASLACGEETEAKPAPVQEEQLAPVTPVSLGAGPSQAAETPEQSSESALVPAEAEEVEGQISKGTVESSESKEKGAAAVGLGADVQPTVALPVAESAAADKVIIDLEEGNQGPVQARKPKEGPESTASQEESLALLAEGQQLVQSVLQTAMELLEAAPEAPPQCSQAALEKEVSPQASAQQESPGEPCQEQTHPDISQDGREAPEKGSVMDESSSRVEEQLLEEHDLQAQGKREELESKASVGLGEGPEEMRTDGQLGGDAQGPQRQSPAPREPETEVEEGSLRASPDTNGPKLPKKEEAQEAEFQEESAQRDPRNEHQAQRQETAEEPEQEPERAEP